MARSPNQKPLDTTSTARKPRFVDVSPIRARLCVLHQAGQQDSDEYRELSERLKACDIVPWKPPTDKY
jgi:hypothetical protein